MPTIRKLLSPALFLGVLLYTATGSADVLYVQDYDSDTYLTGEQKASLQVGYTDDAMYIDKRIRYTGSWMTRFFGKTKQQRNTTQFLLDRNQIREINWVGGEILVFPFERMGQIEWIKDKQAFQEQAQELISARYQAVDPQFKIQILPAVESINGYPCRHAVVNIRLETRDIKKNSSSVTLIKQDLWVSESVPGYGQYRAFHDRLARELGIESQRLGSLNFALRYWNGPLEPIRHDIDRVKGYPVKSRLSVQAQYIMQQDNEVSKTISKTIKTETMVLRECHEMDSLDTGPFEESDEAMKIVMVR